MRRAGCHALALAAAIGLLVTGQLWLGLAGIVLFGIPNAFYNAVVQHWAAGRFGAHGQGAVMGLLSTTFCVANILMALAGAVLTLLDTRLVLALGALLAAWSGWNWLAWGRQAPHPAPVAAGLTD